MRMLRMLVVIGVAVNAVLYAQNAWSADTANKCVKPDGSIVYKWGDCPAGTVNTNPTPVKKPKLRTCGGEIGQKVTADDYEAPPTVNQTITKKGVLNQLVFDSGRYRCYVYTNENDVIVAKQQ